MEMMGWRGAASGPSIVGGASVLVAPVQVLRHSKDTNAARIFSGACFFMGGLLMFTGGVLECILGNTFSFIVFASYGELSSLRPIFVAGRGLTTFSPASQVDSGSPLE